VSSVAATSSTDRPTGLHQQERGALARRQVLERRHERQADALARQRSLTGAGVGVDHPRVGDRLDPALGRELGQVRGVEGHRRAQLVGPHPPRVGAQQVEADVGGDPMEPRAQRRAPLEPLGRAPRAQQGLLDRVLGVARRTQHAIAVPGQRRAVGVELGRRRRCHPPNMPFEPRPRQAAPRSRSSRFAGPG
jgi:hypothetical protein